MKNIMFDDNEMRKQAILLAVKSGMNKYEAAVIADSAHSKGRLDDSQVTEIKKELFPPEPLQEDKESNDIIE